MNRTPRIRAAIAVALACIASISLAQPGATVKILVGFPAGGAPDAVARAFADHLRQMNGNPIVVENKPGASGKIAIDALLSAPADGQTLALIPASVLALVPQVVKAAKYDAVRDFTALGNVAEYGFGVAAGPASNAADITAYRNWARANPRQSNFATPGVGTPQHFLGAQLQKALGVELTHVPYKGGAPALGDVIGGQVPLLITTEQLLVPHEAQGKLKTLFITSRERNPRMPDVPTAREAGLPQLENTDWFGLFVRAGTPAPRVDEWRGLVVKVVASAGYVDAMKNMGYTVPKKQPADFSRQIEADQAAWTERVQLSGFTAAE